MWMKIEYLIPMCSAHSTSKAEKTGWAAENFAADVLTFVKFSVLTSGGLTSKREKQEFSYYVFQSKEK